MEKLNPHQFQNTLQDVRTAYRLLALYQRRLLDVIKFIHNYYSLEFSGGWEKFSAPTPKGRRVQLQNWSWDWLNLYLYEFSMSSTEINGDSYILKIVHQADTGYFDASENKAITKLDIDQFDDLNRSQSRLIFVLSKNEDLCPIQNLLENHLSSENNTLIRNGNWIGVPYGMEHFINEESTIKILEDFNRICKNEFGISLTEAIQPESQMA